MFRKAVQGDVLAVAGIYESIILQEERGFMTIGWAAGVYPVEDTARKALERGDLFVYEEDGEVLASAIINNVQVEGYGEGNWQYVADDWEVMVLHTLVVLPKAGKRGIGKKFVEFYEKYALENGCTELRMDTNEKNMVARRFYKNLGYNEVGIVTCNFNGIPDVNLVLLEKHMAAPED